MTQEETVEGHLSGLWTKCARDTGVLIVEADGAIHEIATNLGIPPSRSYVALVNGCTTDLRYRPTPGDKLMLMTTVEGGGG